MAENLARNQIVRSEASRTKTPIPACFASAQASANASQWNIGGRDSGKIGHSSERQARHMERTSRDSEESLRSEFVGIRTEIQTRRSPGKDVGTSERQEGLRLAKETRFRVQPLGQLAGERRAQQRPTVRRDRQMNQRREALVTI